MDLVHRGGPCFVLSPTLETLWLTEYLKKKFNKWDMEYWEQISLVIIHQIYLFAPNWPYKTHRMTEYSPAKTGEFLRIFPNFQNCACGEEYLKDNKHNSLHWEWKYAWIFVLGHHLFLLAHHALGRLFTSRNR